jgi:uncharacterized protein YecE (DUF72 family)
VKKLKDVEAPLRLFLDRVSFLKEKLGIILWQLPPLFKVNTRRLSDFVSLLQGLCKTPQAFEFRNEGWLCKEVYSKLRDVNMAICIADWPEFARHIPVVADFVYLRRHKAGRYLYGGCYSNTALRADAKKIKSWLNEGRNVFVYFNNDESGYAVKNAVTLRNIIKGKE